MRAFGRSRLPLKIELCDNGMVSRVVDAKGRTVIETDSGYYGPTLHDCQCIVDAVNATQEDER